MVATIVGSNAAPSDLKIEAIQLDDLRPDQTAGHDDIKHSNDVLVLKSDQDRLTTWQTARRFRKVSDFAHLRHGAPCSLSLGCARLYLAMRCSRCRWLSDQLARYVQFGCRLDRCFLMQYSR